MLKKTVKMFACVGVTLLSLTMGTAQAKEISLKVGHVLAPTHPYQLGLEKFSQLVSEKTGGEVKVEVFHSSQLGNEREMIEGLQLGTLDMTLVSTAPLSGFSNQFLVFDLPYIFKTPEVAHATVDGPVGQEILKTLENKGIIGLAYWENGFRHVSNSRQELKHPADVQGLKIRTMENKIHMASFKVAGADPTPMAFGELFTALQQKTVDAQENPIPVFYTSNFFEVQNYLSLSGHFYAASPFLVSKSVWNKLSDEHKQAIKAAAEEARDYERELIKKMDNELMADLVAKGVKITEVDKTEWAAAMQPVYQEYEKAIGAETIEKVREK